MNMKLAELLQQMLETEQGGIKVYRTAIECAINPELRAEWTHYLEQTQRHVEVVEELMAKVGIGPELTPGSAIVRHIGQSLVIAMNKAKGGDPAAAELVACECVVFAETKDHLNWELLAKCAEEAPSDIADALAKAVNEVEEEEDEHLYHSKGWCRELWIQALGMESVLPPPEEQQDVKSAVAAARAKQTRKKSLRPSA
jgi:hypothetical protein